MTAVVVPPAAVGTAVIAARRSQELLTRQLTAATGGARFAFQLPAEAA